MEQNHPSAPGGRSQRPHEARNDGDNLKDTASRVAHEAREKAASAADHVRESAGSVLRSRKDTTADRLHGVAGSFRDVGERLHEQQDGTTAQLVDFAAEQIDCWSSYLRQRDVNDLRNDAENLARRHPAVFLGGAFVAGLALGRFMRSSAPPPHEIQPYGEAGVPSDRYVAAGAATPYRQPGYSTTPGTYTTGGSGAGASPGTYTPGSSGAGPAPYTSGSPGSGAGSGSGMTGYPRSPASPPRSNPGGSSSTSESENRPTGATGPAATGKPLSDERSSTPGQTPRPNPPTSTGAP